MAAGRRNASSKDPATVVVSRTRLGMALERVLRAFWPLGALLAAAWALLAFGLAEAAPRALILAAVAATAIAALVFLVRGLRRLRWPSLAEAQARIDADLPGRPLAALADTPALGADDPGARAVWAAHMARMRRIAARARVIAPDLRLARFDPWGLRLMALAALGAALVFARADPIAGLGAAIAPPGAAVASGPSYEAWAEPPAYTGRPTLYLPEAPQEPALVVPQGTTITVRAYGAPDRYTLEQGVDPAAPPLAEAAPGIAISAFAVTRDGAVAISEGGRTLGAWSFAMQPDEKPSIDLAAPISRAATGETQLSFVASDDHGVVAAQAEVALDLAAVDRRYGLAVDPAPRPPLVIDLPLPMTRGAGSDVAETLVDDFSKHPFAGLPVTIRLIAEDAIGQQGVREGLTTVLPGRRFYNPVAAALVEQRRDLLWSPANAPRVVQVLRAVSYKPEGLFKSERAYLSTRIAIRRLNAAVDLPDNAAQIDEVAEMLWRTAVLLEEGSLGDAAERLARAKERLREALRGDASDEEIAQLMDELREATRDYMQQLAEEAQRNGDSQQAQKSPPSGQTMTQNQIQELMDRIQELSEQGRRAEAEALLEMLQQLLENMEMQLAEGGEGGEGGEGQQSMQDLGDTLREQQDLADDSFRELQRQFREGRGQPGDPSQGQQGQQGQGGPQDQARNEGEGQGGDPQSLADRQQALRELLDELQNGLPGEAGDGAREALERAERDMADAEGELRDGDAAEALDRQADAIDNLRDGMRKMAQDMREAEAGSQAGEPGAEGEAFSDSRSDPLGRPYGSEGSVGTNQPMVPEAEAAARARGLLDEIRRRAGEQARPPLELDYLRRLLDRF